MLEKNKEFIFSVGNINMTIQGESRKHYTIDVKSGSEFKVSMFTDFLYEDFIVIVGDERISITNSNTRSNTKRNFIYPIVNFLNFIYSKDLIYKNVNFKNLEKGLENISVELLDEYIASYANGEIGRGNEERSIEAIEDMRIIITKFLAWAVFVKRTKYGKYKKFDMKYIEESDFNINKFKDKQEILRVVIAPLGKKYLGNRSRKELQKVKNGTYFMVKQLIDVARKKDAMLVFPIVLSSCTGLRIGEVCQMTHERLNSLLDKTVVTKYIDLNTLANLRADAIPVGQIKVRRNQYIHSIFEDILFEEYQNHCELLNEMGLRYNKKSAMFFNRGGKNGRDFDALTQKELARRFSEIGKIASLDIKLAASKGDLNSINENSLIENSKITFHSLRYTYTQLIDAAVKNRAMLAIYRGDKALESSETYLEIKFVDKVKDGILGILKGAKL